MNGSYDPILRNCNVCLKRNQESGIRNQSVRIVIILLPSHSIKLDTCFTSYCPTLRPQKHSTFTTNNSDAKFLWPFLSVLNSTNFKSDYSKETKITTDNLT